MDPPDDGAVSPLDVLLTLMREKWADGDKDEAASLAKAAAPYLHGKAPPAGPAKHPSQMTDDELGGWEDAGEPEDD